MNDEQKQAMDNWHLESLNITISKWGDDAGRYTGKANFTNKDNEFIALKINQEQAGQFLAILVNELHNATSMLSTALVQNIRVMIDPPKKVEELDVQSEG